MSKRDYIALADSIARSRLRCRDNPQALVGIEVAALDIADTLVLTAPNFKRRTFLNACGLHHSSDSIREAAADARTTR